MPNFASTIFSLILCFGNYFYLQWVIDGQYQSSELGAVYFLGLILAILDSLIVWGILRSILAGRKGRLEIEFENRTYEQTDALEGKVIVNLKVPLPVEALSLTLSATKSRRDQERTYNEVVWKYEINLLKSSQLQEGSHSFPFSFNIPLNSNESQSPLISKLVDFVVNGEIAWTLSAELLTPGVDLTDAKTVRVNCNSRF